MYRNRIFPSKIALAFLAIAFYSSVAVCENQSTGFTWINIDGDPQILEEIAYQFKNELTPDVPEQVKPYVPNLHKYIAKIGRYNNVYLVFIGFREHKEDDEGYDHFLAYSYDSESKSKAEVQPKDYYYSMTFPGFAKFEDSPIPDVLVTYRDCLECESIELLSSFIFDQQFNKWTVRLWNGDPHLMIDSDTQIGDDFYNYDCLHVVRDINNDGLDDIVIRCIETEEHTSATSETFTTYSLKNGKEVIKNIKNSKEKDKLSSLLCEGKISPLCSKDN